MERDRPLTYYLDTSVWNQLVHQPKPGRPECIARLKRARDEGQAYTFITRHLLQELVCAFNGHPDLGRQLMKTMREVALRSCLVKDTPALTAQDIHYLVAPSNGRDYLEDRNSEDALKLAHAIDRLADAPFDQQAKDFCVLQLKKLRSTKAEWLCQWRTLLKEERAKLDPKKTVPAKFADWLGDAGSYKTMLAMVTMWTPKNLRSVMPLEELAQRVEETVSFRGMLYQLSSLYFHKVLKKDQLHPGDAFDAHHAVAAAHFEVFVCRDVNARKYAAPWCRNGQRILTLDEFMKDLAEPHLSQNRDSTLSTKNSPDPATGKNTDSLRILTGPDCAALLEDLKKILSETGLKLEEMDLWNDLEDVRWLATQTGPPLRLEDSDPASRQRRLIGFRDAVFIKRSIKALELTRDLDGWTNPTGRLRYWRIREIVGEDDSLTVQKAQQSLDFLYEVEVASRLKFKFSKVRFAEPDLFIESPDLPVAWTIACKRPRAAKSVISAVRKAVEQITKQKRLGIVMISLDNLVDRTVMDISGNSLERACHARMDACTNTFSTNVLGEIQPFPPTPASATNQEAGQGILGVLTSASFLLLGKVGPDGPVFLNTRMEPSMINRNDPEWARKATYFVLNQLKFADEMVKSDY